MIKLFRKIRQNLLSEGKTGKYIKYAIGEIFLVVIGILIALSINNWNQRRLLQNESAQVLENLREEIKESKVETEKATEFLKNRVANRIEFLNYPNQNITDSLKIEKISNMVFFYTKNIKLPILLNELGPNKKIIQWSELTKSLQNLYESIEYYNKGIEYLENDMYSNILPYSVKEGVIIDLMVSNGMLNSQGFLNADVYDSANFRNVIASSTLMTSALFKGAKNILNDYEHLLLIIDEKTK